MSRESTNHKPTQPIAASNANVYYSGHYWNDYPLVRDEINRRTTGSKDMEWYHKFHQDHGRRRFKKALMLNCGNGWLERKLHPLGMFENLVGVDINDELLGEARRESNGLPFTYYKMDINADPFPESGFDLVINLAAVHHIAYIDKVFQQIAAAMTTDGLFVNSDYTGPHRNQYPIEQWVAAVALNESLPPHVQQNMQYPHLPTMLITDPSEAIHSELSHRATGRYFDYVEKSSAGGALAYLLLTHNKNFRALAKDEADKWLRYIMDEDAKYLQQHPNSSMFDYWLAKPKTNLNSVLLAEYRKEEQEREAAAIENGGVYYPLSLIQKLYFGQEEDRVKILHLSSALEQARANLASSSLGSDLRKHVPERAKIAYRKMKPRQK